MNRIEEWAALLDAAAVAARETDQIDPGRPAGAWRRIRGSRSTVAWRAASGASA